MDLVTRRRHAVFVAEHRWGLAFGVAIAVTFVVLPLRPTDAGLAYDVIPLAALGAVWLLAGLGLGAFARYWVQPRATELPSARISR